MKLCFILTLLLLTLLLTVLATREVATVLATLIKASMALLHATEHQGKIQYLQEQLRFMFSDKKEGMECHLSPVSNTQS